ncbi:MAG: hypothetical protein J7K15_10310 [Deltaproteobacteria bacterium]|nr:hypothetical protein [Deltaproteobacteria bacterium]
MSEFVEGLKEYIEREERRGAQIVEHWIILDYVATIANRYTIKYFSQERKVVGTEVVSAFTVPEIMRVVELVRKNKVPRVRVTMSEDYVITGIEIVDEDVKEHLKQLAKRYMVLENGMIQSIDNSPPIRMFLPRGYRSSLLRMRFAGQIVDIVVIKGSDGRPFAVIPMVEIEEEEPKEEAIDEEVAEILSAIGEKAEEKREAEQESEAETKEEIKEAAEPEKEVKEAEKPEEAAEEESGGEAEKEEKEAVKELEEIRARIEKWKRMLEGME